MSVTKTISKINKMLNDEFIDKSHGSPYDRGSADSWYRRPPNAHKWIFSKDNSLGKEVTDLTKKEVYEYNQGFVDNEKEGGHKEW